MWTISNTNMQFSQSLLINKSSYMFNSFARLLDSTVYIVFVSIYTSQLYQVSKLTTFLFNCIVDTDVKDLIVIRWVCGQTSGRVRVRTEIGQ